MATALTSGRVAHGLLITGVRGVGKRRFAARLSAALLCQQRQTDGNACGHCIACRQRMAGTHPDVSRLAPEEGGRTIKVEQIRRFSHALRLTPHYSTARLGWIDPADALSTSAANSLLKTLEEPTSGSHLILISDRPSTLLPTIRSRCQYWPVPPATPGMAREWLAAQGIEPTTIDEDRLRTPLAILARDQNDANQLFQQWDDDLARLLHGRADPIRVAERAAESPDRQLWIDWLYRRCNDLLSASLALPVSDGQSAAVLADGAARLGARRLEAWSHQVSELARIADSNADWRLVTESLFIELSQHVGQARRSLSSHE